MVFAHAPGRAGEHAERLTAGFDGVLQAGAYAGYRRLATGERAGGEPLVLARCWSHARRKPIDAMPRAGSPVAEEALAPIAALYAIEAGLSGSSPEMRRAGRRERSRPIAEVPFAFLGTQLPRLAGKSRLAEAIRYTLKLRDGRVRFLDDGRLEADTNAVERVIRPIAGAGVIVPLIFKYLRTLIVGFAVRGDTGFP